ncbi:MAG: M48 family metalloprotease [Actinomycetota bacterium]|nr:M48 family metalloprotease [Actinomycetota bacterium]
MQVIVASGLVAWYVLVLERIDSATSTVRSPAVDSWMLRLVLEALLVEVTMALALVVVPTIAFTRRARRTGVMSAAATRPMSVRAARSASVQFAVGFVEGLVVLGLMRVRAWPVLVPLVLLALWWSFVSNPRTVQFVASLRRAHASDHWTGVVSGLTSAPIETWVNPVRHYSSAVWANFARHRHTDILIATDTVDQWPVDEQRALLAHELGHVQLGHWAVIRRATVAQRVAAGMIGASVLMIADSDGSRDPVSYSLFRVGSFFAIAVLSMLLSRWRRSIESAADAHALDLTRDPAAFQRMVLSLTRSNRAAVSGLGSSNACGGMAPGKRIELADRWASDHALPPPAP